MEARELLDDDRFPNNEADSTAFREVDERLFRLLDPATAGANTNALNKSEYVDCWGHPYLLAWDTNDDGIIRIDTKEVAARVIVWSCGQNGNNDYGGVDDIVSWESYRTCMRRVSLALKANEKIGD